MSKCKKYGWKGHWFKGKSDKDKKCECGTTFVQETLEILKNKASNYNSDYESIVTNSTFWKFSFIVTIFVISFMIFRPLFSDNDNWSCADKNSKDNITTECMYKHITSYLPQWIFFIFPSVVIFTFVYKFLMRRDDY